MIIKFLTFCLLIFISSTNLYANERVLFEIDNEIFTTIDLKNRTEYLNVINVNKSTKEIYKDFKSVIYFDIYSKNNNINIPAEQINEYISQINNNIDDNIIKNLKYDLQRKVVLEKYLMKKDLSVIKNLSDILNIYDLRLNYIIINKDTLSEKNIDNIKSLNNLNLIENELNLKKIKFNKFEKEIINIKNLDKKIKEKINDFYNINLIEYENFILIGILEKKLKKNIQLELTFYQIATTNEFNKELLYCKNITNLSINSEIKIKKFNKIKIEKLNEYLQKNLVNIEDLIILNQDNNIVNYILLCEINFDEKMLNDLILNKKIENLVKDIELNITKKIRTKYNFIEYE
tara:strand:- start:145 stop:1185 length:1041 start_codon:yes stop_codon:yes gene_type:complete